MKKQHGHDLFSGFSAVFSGFSVSTCLNISFFLGVHLWGELLELGGVPTFSHWRLGEQRIVEVDDGRRTSPLGFCASNLNTTDQAMQSWKRVKERQNFLQHQPS